MATGELCGAGRPAGTAAKDPVTGRFGMPRMTLMTVVALVAVGHRRLVARLR
jgi:hypothetical protein